MLIGFAYARALALLGASAPTPEPTRTATPTSAPTLTRSQLGESDRSCVGCHPQIAAEWWDSQHRSAFTESTFQAAHALEPRAFCRRCHAPQQDPKLTAITPESTSGVGCTSCHPLEEAPSPVQHLASLAADRADAAHPRMREREQTDAETCGQCHEFAFPDAGLRDSSDESRSENRNRNRNRDKNNTMSRDMMQSTVSEHAASRFAGRACATCHMPQAGADDHRSHRFLASRSPAHLRGALLVRAQRRGNVVTITLRAREVGHAVPTGDLLRRLEVGASIMGRPETTQRRYLARHFGNVRQSSGIVVRGETGDDRVPADGSERVVSLQLDIASGDNDNDNDNDNVEWWVRYQRVAHQQTLDERDALLDGEIELASGRLGPEHPENLENLENPEE